MKHVSPIASVLLATVSVGLVACAGDFKVSSKDVNSALSCVNPDNLPCEQVKAYRSLMKDSFERVDVFDSAAVQNEFFGWRKIINDWGTVIEGGAANNVDARIFSDSEMGPTKTGIGALYFYGREGYSTHNIYMVSKTYNINELVQGNGVVINFDYVAFDLDANEFLKVEVCNDTAEACGVGSSVTVDGLNSNKWREVFSTGQLTDWTGLDGRNHLVSQWKSAQVSLLLEDFQKQEFVFRFNVRVDEGFQSNDHSKGLVDGVALDNVRVTAYQLSDDNEPTVPRIPPVNDDRMPTVTDF